MPNFKMEDSHFYILKTGSRNHIIVTGKYLLILDKNADKICE